MVLIHTKTSEEKHQFVFETNVNVLIKNLKKELVIIHNLKCRILKLIEATSDLAKYGPCRPEELRGLSDEELKMSQSNCFDLNCVTSPDENNFRTGIPPPKDVADNLLQTLNNIKNELGTNKVDKITAVTTSKLNEFLNLIIKGLDACYPSMQNLPTYDITRIIIEKKDCFNDELKINETSIWWAGKELNENNYLHNIIGKNEKTKIIVKLHPTKLGPPEREAKIDEETYKAMLSYYYKKQNEEKAMEEDDDDSYLNSEWANPLSLQKQLHGNLSNIKWKP
ncbi:conserved protein, unknown function [Hepatocystis sp. ex Piliocolobus tephrosceles]|nr:conserved protein, unknown function [Hepatocystis sp. ex Piliocolobus tephrosceles]